MYLGLSGGTDTRDRETNVDSRSNTLEEEFCLQENLAIRDGNDVGGDIGRYVTTLGFDDRECGEGATTVLVVHLGCTLEETRMKVEHITGYIQTYMA